jgi:glycosyltransferase involved in cell wall biosynthesis
MPPVPAEAPSEAHQAARDWAADWCQRWFLDVDGSDRFRLGAVDAGWATHVEAFLLLQQVALDALGQRGERARPSLRRALKARGLDRLARSLGMRVVAGSTPEPKPLAVVVEIPTPSMIEPAMRVADTAGPESCAIAASDPRAVGQLRRRGLRPHPLLLGWREEQRVVRAARHELAPEWHRLRAEPPRMALRGRDLAGDALVALDPLVTRSMPWIAAESMALERWVEAVDPSAIAIASDQHRIGRIATSVAGRRDIATVVLQHGLPQARIGFLPVVADRVATWSAGSTRWFETHGTPRDRLEVTGNPRLDVLVRGTDSEATPASLLLALSPTAPSTNLAVVAGVLGALDLLPGWRLVVKLHPGQADWTPIERLVRERADGRVALRRHEALYPLIRAASVTILLRSTVAVESLAAGRPVVVYRAGGEPTTADEELRALDLPVVADAESLAATVARLGRPEERERYFADRRTSIEQATGPLDGGSAARIVALLRDAPRGGRSDP